MQRAMKRRVVLPKGYVRRIDANIQGMLRLSTLNYLLKRIGLTSLYHVQYKQGKWYDVSHSSM